MKLLIDISSDGDNPYVNFVDIPQLPSHEEAYNIQTIGLLEQLSRHFDKALYSQSFMDIPDINTIYTHFLVHYKTYNILNDSKEVTEFLNNFGSNEKLLDIVHNLVAHFKDKNPY